MSMDKFCTILCLCAVSAFVTANLGCQIENEILNVNSGEECTLSASAAFKSVSALGSLVVGDDVNIVVEEGFYTQGDLSLGSGSLVDASYISISDSAVTMGHGAELRSRSFLHLLHNVDLKAPHSGVLSAQEYNFGMNVALNSVAYPDYVQRFIRSSTSFTVPTPSQLVAFLDSSLMLLEGLEDNPSPSAQKLVYQQLFASQVQAQTCQTVFVEVKETLDTVYSELEVVVEEASDLAVRLEETEEEVQECGNMLGACEIYVYENKYDTSLPSPIPIPDDANDASPVVIPPDLTFRYVLQIEKSTGGTVTEGEIAALKAAVIDQLALKLAIPKTSIVIQDSSLVANNVIFSINIVTPAFAPLAFAQETGVRLNTVPAQVFFEDLPDSVPSFAVQGGQPVFHDTAPNAPNSGMTKSNVPTSERFTVIVSSIVGAVGALVGAAVATVLRRRKTVEVQDEPTTEEKPEKEQLDSVDVDVAVTQLKL